MKRVALSVALLLVWLAPKLESTAIACLSRNPCKQPPCELFYELKIMKAMARLWSLPVLRNEQDSNRVTAKITKLSKKYAKCPANYFYQPPPIFTLGPGSKCDIVYPPGTSSLDQVLASTNTCAEFVHGRFKEIEQARLFCLSNSDLRGPLPEGLFRLQMRLTIQTYTEFLESELGRFLSSCAPSATTSRRVTAAGLQALRKASYKKRMEWADRLVKEVAQ